MADFKPIETQEAFDAAIAQRIARAQDTVRQEYADYDKVKASYGDLQRQIEAANKQKGEYESRIEALQTQCKGYETDALKTRIALETGLPFQLRDRLNGDTEESLRADAQTMLGLIGRQKPAAPPLADPEAGKTDPKTAALRGTLAKLKGGE